MNKGKYPSRYLPTQQQIQRDCTKIQRTWSERERRRRTVAGEREVQLPFYSARSVGRGILDLDRDDTEIEIVTLRH